MCFSAFSMRNMYFSAGCSCSCLATAYASASCPAKEGQNQAAVVDAHCWCVAEERRLAAQLVYYHVITQTLLTLEHVQSQPAAFNAAVILLTACYAQGPACVISHHDMFSRDLSTCYTLCSGGDFHGVTCWAVSCVDDFAYLLA